MVGVLSPEYEACDLDTEEQWELLERKLNRRANAIPDFSLGK
jgi:hypothetical protein